MLKAFGSDTSQLVSLPTTAGLRNRAMTSLTIPPGLIDLLQQYDVCGSEGNSRFGSPWKPRINLLLDNIEVQWKDDTPILTGTWLNQEGGSLHTCQTGTFHTTADALVDDREMKLTISWERKEVPTLFPRKMYLLQVRDSFHDWRSDDVDYIVDDGCAWVPVDAHSSAGIHVFETFSGGFGGWAAQDISWISRPLVLTLA